MLDWLEKKLLPPARRGGGAHLPSILESRGIERAKEYLVPLTTNAGTGNAELPNATIIYAVGAAALYAVAFFHLFSGNWFVGLMLFLPASALLGFALHYLRFPR